MGQAGSFRQRCSSGGELDVDYLIRMESRLKMKWVISVSSIEQDGFKVIKGQ